MQLEEGKIVEGKITGITNFGAFVDLGEGVTGLCHISEISTSYVKDINDHIKVGQSVFVKILPSDKKGKIGLSIKQAMEEKGIKEEKVQKPFTEKKQKTFKPYKPDFSVSPVEFEWGTNKDSDLSFEDKLNKFKQSSDEKMHDIKRNLESKRGASRGKGSY